MSENSRPRVGVSRELTSMISAILKPILREGLDLVIGIEAHRDDLALDLGRAHEGRLLGRARNIIIAVALHVDAGRRRRRAENADHFGFGHAFAQLREGAGLGEIAVMVDSSRAGGQDHDEPGRMRAAKDDTTCETIIPRLERQYSPRKGPAI